MKKTLWSILYVAVVTCGNEACSAESVTLKGNTVEMKESLRIALNGHEVMEKDEFTTAGSLYSTEATDLQKDSSDGAQVLNVINTASERFQFRKEVALHRDGSIEVTSRFKVAPWQESHSVCHQWCMPLELIKGCRFKALVGNKRTRITTGMVGDPGWAKKLFNAHYIAFEGGDIDFTLDLNPYGVTDWMSYPKWGCPVGQWKVRNDANHLIFWYGTSGTFYGGTFAGKLVIQEGKWAFEERHPYVYASYYGLREPVRRIIFGGSQTGYVSAETKGYAGSKGWSWVSSVGLEKISSKKKGVINNCVAGSGSNTFRMDLIPGYYIFTLRASNPKKESGSFAVSLNGGDPQTVAFKEGHPAAVLLSGYVDEGRAEIAFEGADWCVNSIAAQPVVYEAEDFVFKRGMWNVPGLVDFY